MKYFFLHKKSTVKIFFLLVCFLCLFSCNHTSREKKKKETVQSESNDLERISSTGTLRAVVDYNSTNYFVYRGKPMGFKYELLKQLTSDLGVNLEIVVSNNLAETFNGLQNKRFDLIAKNLTVTKQRNSLVDFTVPLEQTRQVLVQRSRENQLDSVYVNSTLELAGKEIHVQKNTSYYRRMVNLSEEIGEDIHIVQDTVYGVEQLIALVAEGEINYTVCDENIALLNKMYYPNLDVSLKVSFPQNIAWAVRKDSKEWKEYLDNWISKFKRSRKYHVLYHKYFESPRTAERLGSDFHSISGGNISKYDNYIKEFSEEYGWDWRLIASVVYHESRFNAQAESWAGAYGLMQIMPSTARSLGVENFERPKQNIKAGILLLDWLDEQLSESVRDSTERIKFILASYNVGLGHVKDAQRLARKYEKNSEIWDDNVDFYLRNKSAEKYYKDPVVRWGYCRGEEAYLYVSKVLNNYQHYLNVIPE
ncbi:transporter substrate-binding domain-containing protein [Maribellus maritimus]|nr:transporter substrate-binding domain-containing protein [Maribellus maritimus]